MTLPLPHPYVGGHKAPGNLEVADEAEMRRVLRERFEGIQGNFDHVAKQFPIETRNLQTNAAGSDVLYPWQIQLDRSWSSTAGFFIAGTYLIGHNSAGIIGINGNGGIAPWYHNAGAHAIPGWTTQWRVRLVGGTNGTAPGGTLTCCIVYLNAVSGAAGGITWGTSGTALSGSGVTPGANSGAADETVTPAGLTDGIFLVPGFVKTGGGNANAFANWSVTLEKRYVPA